jgi:osmotically inducible lipoprotein OsmB
VPFFVCPEIAAMLQQFHKVVNLRYCQSRPQKQVKSMKRTIVTFIAVLGLASALTACNSPGERAVGGALIGGGGGALIGGALGGRRGALLGGGIGAISGAVVGGSTAPQPYYGGEPVYVERAPRYRRSGCPYGAYQDEYGNVYCR